MGRGGEGGEGEGKGRGGGWKGRGPHLCSSNISLKSPASRELNVNKDL